MKWQFWSLCFFFLPESVGRQMLPPQRANTASVAVKDFACRMLYGSCLLLGQLILTSLSKRSVHCFWNALEYFPFEKSYFCCPWSTLLVYLPSPNSNHVFARSPCKVIFPPSPSTFLLSLQCSLFQKQAYCPHNIFFPVSHLPR